MAIVMVEDILKRCGPRIIARLFVPVLGEPVCR